MTRKTAAKLVPGDVIYVLDTGWKDETNLILSWQHKATGEVKTVATNTKGEGWNRGDRIITFTDGSQAIDRANVCVKPVPVDAVPAAPVAAEPDTSATAAAVEPAEEPVTPPTSTDTDYVRCTSGPRGKVHLGLRIIADYVVPTCMGKSRGSARYSVIEPTADITCKRCLTRYGIVTEEPTPVESTGDDRVAVNVHPHIAAYVSGRRGSDPIERALAEILSDVVLHPERATGHSMTTITGADSATKDGSTTPLLQVDLTIDQANVLYRLTAELSESTDPDMQVYRRYSLSGLSQLRAAGIRPADTVAVNLPLSLFGHLGAEGYADDQVSERRRTLYAELAAAPQCRMRRVLHVTAMVSDLSANTLFDAMLDLWKLRRRGASDLRRAALGVLADLQAVGVRSDEYLPTGTSADPVMTGVETLRSLLRL